MTDSVSEPNEVQPPLTDEEREVAVDRIRGGLLRDEVSFDELGPRFAAVYRAETRTDLVAVTSDLTVLPPPPVPHVAHPIAGTGFTLFGDLRKGGDIAVEGDLTYFGLFGDVVLDLSSAELRDNVTVTVWGAFGDTIVILPDGVRASLASFTVFGDKREDLAPAVAGAPTIRIASRRLFGDTRVYSLSRVPEGRLRKLWRSLRSG